jgi:4-amino-4-deoxy-L-arabinose transferase-like glycosyltransferase
MSSGVTAIPTEQPTTEAPAGARVKHLTVLLLILALGAAVRLGLWLAADGHPLSISDEYDYNALAINLAEHGEYAFTSGQPNSLRPPLYPALVSVVYRLFGAENFQAVRLVQAVLSLGLVVLMYHVGSVVFSPRVGLCLAGLCCFYPTLLGYNNLILTEVLFTFLLCAFCAVLIQALRRESLAWLAAAGVVLGLAALTRSVLWLFPPVLAVFVLLAFHGSWRRRLLAAVSVVVAFALPVAPWAVRNTRLQHTFIAIDVMGGRNFMMGNYRYTPLYRSWAAIEITGDESWIHEIVTTYPSEEPRTQGQIDKLALRQALKFVVANPGLTARRDLVKFFDFWGLERELVAGADRGLFGAVPPPLLLLLTLAICGSYAFALLTAVFGATLAPPRNRRVHLFLLLLVAYVCGLHSLAFGHSRYHLPLMPLILLYTASAMVHRHAIWQQRRSWRFLLTCGIGVVFVGGWVWMLVAVDGERVLNLLRSFT